MFIRSTDAAAEAARTYAICFNDEHAPRALIGLFTGAPAAG